jgi:hypothetical protein
MPQARQGRQMPEGIRPALRRKVRLDTFSHVEQCAASRPRLHSCQCSFNLLMTDSMATEPTEKHGKNEHPLECFPCPSVAINKCWHPA